MSKLKLSLASGAVCLAIGAASLFGVQSLMKATSSTAFCVSCHSMDQPKKEWEGSTHFSNRKGVRAECADCHVPQDGLHYVKAKFVALKDVWYTLTNKLPDVETYEKHRAEMAQRVWEDLKNTDSATCRSCHSEEAMITAEQSDAAQKMHKIAKENQQTCIDCHKGIVHFLPEVEENGEAVNALAKHGGQFTPSDAQLHSLTLSPVKVLQGGEARLMPYANVSDWREEAGKVIGRVEGWQQVGAESLVYTALGKRINVALLDDEAKAKVNVLETVFDPTTNADWKHVSFELEIDKTSLTADLDALNQYGNNLNQSYCSGCHAPIGASYYTANQWIGVINSMKDHTSMSDDQVRMVTLYLQRNAKDIAGKAH